MEYKDLPKENSERWLDRTPLEGEEWRPVPNYNDYYEVSNYGRVYSIERIVKSKAGWSKVVKPRMMRCVMNGYGYWVVTLTRDSVGYFVGIHILVGRAFLSNPLNLPQINHKDENKQNNIVRNLEWCNALYNNNYGTRNIRLKETQLNDENKSLPVLQYTMKNELVREYPSIAEASRLLGISERSISCVCKRKKNCFSALNFKWKFKNDPLPIELFPIPKLYIRVKGVSQYKKDGSFVACYKNAREAYRKTGIQSCSILRCARGVRKTKSAGGFIWKFANE